MIISECLFQYLICASWKVDVENHVYLYLFVFVFICICFKTRFNLLTKACVLN